MNDKKKKIYIAIISVCVVVTGVMLYMSFGGSSSPEVPAVLQQQPVVNNQPNSVKNGGVPSVFPSDTKFDTSIFESSRFKSLKPGKDITVSESELGRENPFAKY
jgi:flagellar basal body-associated protein FliL